MPTRTPEQIRASIELNRSELGSSIERAAHRGRRRSPTGAGSCATHRREALIAAAVAGFVIGGGIAGVGGVLFGRRSAAAAKPRSSLGIPPTPSSPGPTCVPITGPISDTKQRVAAEDLAAALDEPRGFVGRLDVLHDPCVGAVVVALPQVLDHPLERARRTCARARPA